MGEHVTTVASDPASLRAFTTALLDDLDALEKMLQQGRIETDVRRVGAEQEMFLVDGSCRPAPAALAILEILRDDAFTTELGAYNLELNAEPAVLTGRCLSELEGRLASHLADAAEAAAGVGVRIVLCGILPTLRRSDVTLENMVPHPRYVTLNEALGRLRGGPWRVCIRGLDQVACTCDTVMLESACTSFQIHLQVAPEAFAPLYNLAQAVAAPVLAAAANSPLLFGRRLWQETRIPVFQQAIDTRRAGHHLREVSARVRFGEDWVQESILELLREDVIRFRILLGDGDHERSLDVLRQGDVPRLHALRLHNGTVYRWNRGCYGVTDGVPHLRIEMRSLPAGPSLADEVANTAVAFGSMLGLHAAGIDVRRKLPFESARANFQAAAEAGLESRLRWLDGRDVSAVDLLLGELLPAAREGLLGAGLETDDVDHYLGIFGERVRSRRTGAAWILTSFAALEKKVSRQQVTPAITAAMIDNQASGAPVHLWETVTDMDRSIPTGAESMDLTRIRVEEIMTTDIYTVGPEEIVDVPGRIMEWKSVRHIPVEDDDQRVVGMLSCLDVLREMGRRRTGTSPSVCVRDVMTPAPMTIPPDAPVADALRLMAEEGKACLPVARDGRLVGIVAERDFLGLLARLLPEPLPSDSDR